MAHIAIDMTPVFPGGENGGAKLLAMQLIKGFQSSPGDHKLLILTASWNDEDLAFLDSPNTRRLRILEKKAPKDSKSLPGPEWLTRGLRRLYRFIKSQYAEKVHPHGPLYANGVDVLLCPFTATTYAEHGIPVISVICDLQHKEYPQFFNNEEIDTREFFLNGVRKRADAIVCISESTKKAVIRHLHIDSDKISVIHICIQSRLTGHDKSIVKKHLHELGINGCSYMFYPANFWPHKNHEMLIAAYGMYLARNPQAEIDLVFTGALDEAQRVLQDKVYCLGLDRQIHFLGYLPDEQLISVWQGSSFLIFPSLYEGFGIPVLEAMQFGKSVLCGNVTSLPEVAGNAALYFDPRKPEDIVQCMEEIIKNRKLQAKLIKNGHERLSHFQPEDMAKKYLKVIEGVKSSPIKYHDEVKDILDRRQAGNHISR